MTTKNPMDLATAMVNITAGAGGVDAHLWAADVERMLIRYAERCGFTLLDQERRDGAYDAGILSSRLMLGGDGAYQALLPEAGIHRMVRVSTTDPQKRRITTFARVDVRPVNDEDPWKAAPVRSYVLAPYVKITDHHTNIETTAWQAVLDGDLDLVRTVKPGLVQTLRAMKLGEEPTS